jgi:hypothetical protein
MMLVSLVLKLFVSSRPLKLEGVLCIYVLLSHEGQAENHLYVFPYDLNTRLTFIVSFSWSFVCVHFHVITWLLSFFYEDYIFHAHVLSSLIPAHNAYIYDQDCVGACHLKNYFFCDHLPTRGRAGVKLLGMLIRLQRIHNFWCSCVLEMLHRNILRIGRNKSQTSRYFTELPEHRRGDGAEPEGGHIIGQRGLGLARAPWWCGPLVYLWRCPFAYKDPPTGKT